MASKKAASHGSKKRAAAKKSPAKRGAATGGAAGGSAAKKSAKKSAAKSAAKKSAVKSGGESAAESAAKSPAARGAAKKGGAVDAAAAGKCGGWESFHDFMPPLPARLRVTGRCRFPSHGYKVTLKEATRLGTPPQTLLLEKIVTPPTGPVIPEPETVEVAFRKKTNTKYATVRIIPDGVTIKVQQVF